MDVLSSWWGGGKTEQESTAEAGPMPNETTENTENSSSSDAQHDETEAPSSTKSTTGDEPTIKPELSITAEAALNSAKEWGSYLFNFAKEGTKKVTETAAKTATIIQKTVEEKTIVGDFKKEQDKFVKEKHSKRAEAAVPPWVGYNEEEQMKEQILALSQDKRNFLRNPPAGVQFQFDFASMFPVAMATLQEDEKLQKMRFDLVPKMIVEENFWRNYFYRVSLIKQSSQLTSLAASSGSLSDSKSAETSSTEETSSENGKDKSQVVDISVEPTPSSATEDEVPGSPPGSEFISDAFVSEIDEAEIQKGFEQLGMDKKEEENNGAEDIPEWEKELQQELQDYEVVDDEGEAAGNEEWEREIDQMLEDEEGAVDSK